MVVCISSSPTTGKTTLLKTMFKMIYDSSYDVVNHLLRCFEFADWTFIDGDDIIAYSLLGTVFSSDALGAFWKMQATKNRQNSQIIDSAIENLEKSNNKYVLFYAWIPQAKYKIGRSKPDLIYHMLLREVEKSDDRTYSDRYYKIKQRAETWDLDEDTYQVLIPRDKYLDINFLLEYLSKFDDESLEFKLLNDLQSWVSPDK